MNYSPVFMADGTKRIDGCLMWNFVLHPFLRDAIYSVPDNSGKKTYP